MKTNRCILSLTLLLFAVSSTLAQVETGGVVRKRSERDKAKTETGVKITDRMQSFYEKKETHDADLAYMRQIYRSLDLTKEKNSPLYYPEDVIDGQENLFRIILKQVVDGNIPAYEYLDGREVFTDQYKVNVADMLDRFGIYYQQGKGSTEKNPKYVIEEADVPTGQVLNYYIIEKWEFDKRSNRMRTVVEAICPVLNRSGDFGGEAKYPMFWVKYDALRPWLSQQYVFLTDDNNLPLYSLDDYFNTGMYDGEIYKTRNLRNLSMNQMFPDADDLARAQDSIDHRLRTFGKDLWVPTREEYLEQKELEEEIAAKIAAGDSVVGKTVADEKELNISNARTGSSRVARRSASASASKKKTVKAPKVKKAPSSSGSSGNSNAAKSVRRRKK